MADNSDQEMQKAKPVEAQNPFNFREELKVFLEDGEIFSDYYDSELRFGISPERIETQVCTRVGYVTETSHQVNNVAEQLVVPVRSRRIVRILAPPVTPYVDDELMPQDLWEIVKSDDTSKVPVFDNLKCVEISISNEHTFKIGNIRKNLDIYRVDLTKGEPVVYKRYPIPKNEQAKRDALGRDEDAKTMSALLEFVQPTPKYKYEKIGSEELVSIVGIINDIRAAVPAPSVRSI